MRGGGGVGPGVGRRRSRGQRPRLTSIRYSGYQTGSDREGAARLTCLTAAAEMGAARLFSFSGGGSWKAETPKQMDTKITAGTWGYRTIRGATLTLTNQPAAA